MMAGEEEEPEAASDPIPVILSNGSRRRGVGVGERRWRLPVADCAPCGSVRSVGRVVAAFNFVIRAPATPLFIYAVRQGPTNQVRVGRPRSGRGPGCWAFGPNLEIY